MRQHELEQSRIQSPQALRPAVGRQERLWGTEILLLANQKKKKLIFRILQSLLAKRA